MTTAQMATSAFFGPGGQRLAKRDGAITLAERLEVGESMAAIVGWMGAGLGLIDWGQPATAADASRTLRSHAKSTKRHLST